MKTQFRFAVAALGLTGVFGAAPLALAGQPHDDYVAPAVHHGGGIDRTIVIDDKTKWVNVKEDETIRFVVVSAGEQKSFGWKFDMRDLNTNLRDLAPKGLLGERSIQVYLAPTRSAN